MAGLTLSYRLTRLSDRGGAHILSCAENDHLLDFLLFFFNNNKYTLSEKNHMIFLRMKNAESRGESKDVCTLSSSGVSNGIRLVSA